MTPAELQRLKKSIPASSAPAGRAYRLPGQRLAVFVGRVTKSVDTKRMTVQSVLTYPGEDYVGDIVEPAGGEWQSVFPRDPSVNWEHREPIARGSVPTLKAFTVDGETMQLPVGTSTFFQHERDLQGLSLNERDPRSGTVVGRYKAADCLDAAESAFRLVADDIARGVSLEFKPNGPEGRAYKSTGKYSVVEQRSGYHWIDWTGLGWAHAMQPVNPNALTILGSERLEKCLRLKETGKFPGGKPVSAIILKSFAGLVRPPRPVTVRVERKAMPLPDEDDPEFDPDAAPEGVEDVKLPEEETAKDAPADDEAVAADGALKATPQMFMTARQGAMDLADQLEAVLNGPTVEHEKGIAEMQKFLAEFRDIASEIGSRGSKLFPGAGFESESGESDMPEQAADGAILSKAFPDGYPVRFRLELGGGFKRVEAPPPSPDDDAAGDAMLLKSLADKQAELAERAEKLDRTRRRLDRIAARNGY